MKSLRRTRYVLLLLATPFVGCTLAWAQLPSSNEPWTNLMLLYDRNFTMRAGAEDIFAIHYALTRTEDVLLGTQWFPENESSEKMGGVLLRSAKSVLLDLPIDGFSFIFAHEYFGHGARLRELSDAETKYHISIPIYGGNQSWAYAVGSIPFTYQGMLASYAGGTEAQQILNKTIALNWMTTDQMHYRDAALYFFSFLNYYPSTVRTKGQLPVDDASWYLYMLNVQAASTASNNPTMSQETFHSRMALGLLNPFVFYSMYSYLKTYIWDGKAVSDFPLFQTGSVRYLPALSSAMTPFGIEYHLENYLRFGSIAALVEIRVGDQTFHSSWGGFGVSCKDIHNWSNFSVDVNIDVWKQPELAVDGAEVIWSRKDVTVNGSPAQPKGGGFGGAISFRGYYRFGDLHNSLEAIAEVGYKSIGFLQGYNLDASPTLMIGIGYQL